jgi:hypothetical protein
MGRTSLDGLVLVRRAAAGANPVQAVTMSGPSVGGLDRHASHPLRVGRAVAWQDALAQVSGSARAGAHDALGGLRHMIDS